MLVAKTNEDFKHITEEASEWLAGLGYNTVALDIMQRDQLLQDLNNHELYNKQVLVHKLAAVSLFCMYLVLTMLLRMKTSLLYPISKMTKHQYDWTSVLYSCRKVWRYNGADIFGKKAMAYSLYSKIQWIHSQISATDVYKQASLKMWPMDCRRHGMQRGDTSLNAASKSYSVRNTTLSRHEKCQNLFANGTFKYHRQSRTLTQSMV